MYKIFKTKLGFMLSFHPWFQGLTPRDIFDFLSLPRPWVGSVLAKALDVCRQICFLLTVYTE